MPSEKPIAPLVIPTINSQPEVLPPALVSWHEVIDAYKQAWDALDDIDDHHTAFLALHVVQNAVQAYHKNLAMRPPKDGDLANLRFLRERMDASYANHARFIDEPHLDYAALRKSVLAELQALREDATRRGVMHAIGMACVEFAPLSYSSSIDDMLRIEEAVHLIESYRELAPVFEQQFDMKPLASTMQSIAAALPGFSDYKDEKFTTMFEDLTVRIGKLHLARKSNKPRA